MFDDVYLVDDELQLIADAAIVAAEDKLGMKLPIGYHAFLQLSVTALSAIRCICSYRARLNKEPQNFEKHSPQLFLWIANQVCFRKNKSQQRF